MGLVELLLISFGNCIWESISQLYEGISQLNTKLGDCVMRSLLQRIESLPHSVQVSYDLEGSI